MSNIYRILLLAMLSVGMSCQLTMTGARAESPIAVQNSPVASKQTIDQLIASIKSAKKPLPAWALDLALRAADLWKTHQNGKRVGEVQAEVIAILKIVADIKIQVESGHEMTDREFRLTRELLDSHSRHIDHLTGRVEVLELKTEAQAMQFAAAQDLATELQRQLEIARKRTLAIEKELAAERERVAAMAARLYRPGCGTGNAYRGDKCIDVAANPK